MQDPDGAMKTISLLRSFGIAFALDDFGTGYSSLAYLKNLPVQSIKIDQSFVRDMVTDSRDASIVRAAIELGHNFSLDIVAEGVESAVVHDLLTSLDCDHAQGFHFARPMPSDEFLAWHRAATRDSGLDSAAIEQEGGEGTMISRLSRWIVTSSCILLTSLCASGRHGRIECGLVRHRRLRHRPGPRNPPAKRARSSVSMACSPT